MIDGINSNRHKNLSISDTCGSRVLNMGGSLTGYIKTGNPYHKDYYVRRQNKIKKDPDKKVVATLNKILPFALTALGTIAAIKFGPKYFSKATEAIKAKVSALPKPTEAFKGLKEKISNIKIGEKLRNIFKKKS